MDTNAFYKTNSGLAGGMGWRPVWSWRSSAVHLWRRRAVNGQWMFSLLPRTRAVEAISLAISPFVRLR
jgi:hypothetical protein